MLFYVFFQAYSGDMKANKFKGGKTINVFSWIISQVFKDSAKFYVISSTNTDESKNVINIDISTENWIFGFAETPKAFQ